MIAKILGILEFLKGLWGAIQQAIAQYRLAKKEGWINDNNAVHDAIREAKSDVERRELAKKLADLVRRSPTV